jgi:hypothetical protein
MEWINIKDRLPELTATVITCNYMTKDVEVSYWCKKRKRFYYTYNPYARIYENENKGVQYWMPLPKPPEDA